MVCGSLPFKTLQEIVKRDKIDFKRPISNKCCDLISACLAFEESDHIELNNSLVKHAWFKLNM